MRLPAVPVTSFPDATLNAETLQALLTTPNGQALPFLQLLTAQTLYVQAASTVVATTVGHVNKTVTLPTAWPSTHVAFIATGLPQGFATATDFFVGAQVSSAAAGLIQLSSSGTQNFSVSWVSFGF